MKTQHTHVQRYLDPPLEKFEDGEIDPSFVVTHQADLEDFPEMYETFDLKEGGWVEVVMTPSAAAWRPPR